MTTREIVNSVLHVFTRYGVPIASCTKECHRDASQIISEALTDAQVYGHGEGQKHALVDVAKLLGCEPDIGAIEKNVSTLKEAFVPRVAQQIASVILGPVERVRERLAGAAEMAAIYGPAAWEKLTADTAYRPGLPSVEQVRAHEERGGRWHVAAAHAEILSFAVHDTPMGPSIVMRARPDQIWQGAGILGKYIGPFSCRPCLPDGTPCAWPDPAT